MCFCSTAVMSVCHSFPQEMRYILMQHLVPNRKTEMYTFFLMFLLFLLLCHTKTISILIKNKLYFFMTMSLYNWPLLRPGPRLPRPRFVFLWPMCTESKADMKRTEYWKFRDKVNDTLKKTYSYLCVQRR